MPSRRDSLPPLLLRARARPCLHAGIQRDARAGARGMQGSRPHGRRRLRGGGVPRLLARAQRVRPGREPRQAGHLAPALCGARPAWAVRGCWFRALLEHPPAPSPIVPATSQARCAAASARCSVRPASPVRWCSGVTIHTVRSPAVRRWRLRPTRCPAVRGVKAQALAGQPVKDLVRPRPRLLGVRGGRTGPVRSVARHRAAGRRPTAPSRPRAARLPVCSRQRASRALGRARARSRHSRSAVPATSPSGATRLDWLPGSRRSGRASRVRSRPSELPAGRRGQVRPAPRKPSERLVRRRGQPLSLVAREPMIRLVQWD